MRIPLTKYGWPQVVVFPAVVFAAMAACLLAGVRFLPLWAVVLVEAILAAVLIWVLAFFRDPYRPVPADSNLLLAPADGRITDIEIVEENDFIGGTALRIGIFLSIFDAHINRAPCNVRVERITYKKGKHKNAANPRSGRFNESNDLAMVRTDKPQDRLIVRQISGAIARRIVCQTRQGENLTGGEKFGMIKFGSRTELYLPAPLDANPVRSSTSYGANNLTDKASNGQEHLTGLVRENAELLVKMGDRVKAGLTALVKYSMLDTGCSLLERESRIGNRESRYKKCPD